MIAEMVIVRLDSRLTETEGFSYDEKSLAGLGFHYWWRQIIIRDLELEQHGDLQKTPSPPNSLCCAIWQPISNMLVLPGGRRLLSFRYSVFRL